MRCRETLLESFGLGLNVSTVPLQPSLRGAFARKHRRDLSQSTLRNGMALISDEEKRKLEEMGGGFIQRMIDGKAPSIKEMKAIIRKAGFGVADLVEKSEVEARYREALVRLGDYWKQDESYTGYFEREEDLK